jgi:hypothetical protein
VEAGDSGYDAGGLMKMVAKTGLTTRADDERYSQNWNS